MVTEVDSIAGEATRRNQCPNSQFFLLNETLAEAPVVQRRVIFAFCPFWPRRVGRPLSIIMEEETERKGNKKRVHCSRHTKLERRAKNEKSAQATNDVNSKCLGLQT